MSKFVDGVEFVTESCCNCHMPFAMTRDFQRVRLNDHKTFHCPAGHPQHYTGKSEAQKLQEQLDAKARQLENAQQNVERVRNERDAIAKAHRKMRVRVMNGVCPCCNRSFENLRQHMQTQHADFGQPQTLRALREAFGLTQAAVALEAGTKAAYVSMYENGKPVPVEARESLDWWLDRQDVKGRA